VHVAENVQQGKLISQPKLVYPPEAQRAHVQGAVQVQAVIGADGRVKSAHAVSGPPALQAAAVSNVNGRQYSPTEVGGKAVEVTTEVTVNFTAPK
jgi:TonB family protein